jgi:hypothetical protein
MIEWSERGEDAEYVPWDSRPMRVELGAVALSFVAVGCLAVLGRTFGLDLEAVLSTGGSEHIAPVRDILMGCLGLALLTMILAYAVARRALLDLLDPRPGRGVARERRGLRGVGRSAFDQLLSENEELRGVVLVDEPAARRPRVTVFVSLLLLAFSGAGCVINMAALTSVGHIWVELLLVVAYGLLPMLGLLIAAFVPGDLLLVVLGLAVSLGWWGPVAVVSAASPWAMGGTGHGLAVHSWVPPLWGTAAVLGSWLLLRSRKRARRVLLVTTQGLRVVEVDDAGARGLGGVHRPEAMIATPGSYYQRWYFTEGEGDALEVHPFADDPDVFLEACKGVGLSVEVISPAAGQALPRELRELGWRLALVPVLLAMAWGVTFPILDLGLRLGLQMIPHIAPSMETRAGAEDMEAGCREILEVHPESLSAWCFLALMQHTAGDYEGAEASLASAEAVVAGAHFPKLLESGQTHRLLTQLRESIAKIEEKGRHERKPPPPGWAPEGPDGDRFQVILERALGVREHMWVSHWPEDAAELLAIADRHPQVAGPAWMGTLLAYDLSGDTKVRAFLFAAGVDASMLPPEAPPDPEPFGGGAKRDDRGFVTSGYRRALDLQPVVDEARMARLVRDQVLPRLARLEGLSAWRGSEARLRGRVPAMVNSSVRSFFARHEEGDGSLDHPMIRQILADLDVPGSLGAPYLEGLNDDAPEWALALDPPADLAALADLWPALDVEETARGRRFREFLEALRGADLAAPRADPRVAELWPVSEEG